MKLHFADATNDLLWDSTHHIAELVIESPELFRSITKELTAGSDGSHISISHNGVVFKLGKEIHPIANPTMLDFNNRLAMATLLKLLVKSSLSDEFYLSTNKLKTRIVKYIDEVIEAENFEFEVNTKDFALDSLAKAVNIHIVGDEDDFVELLIDYLSMMAELANTKLFIFLNLRLFLSQDELNRFKHSVDNHQLDLLLLEGHDRGTISDCPRLIIDSDLCEL